MCLTFNTIILMHLVFNFFLEDIQSLWNTEGHLCDLNELIAKVRLPYFRYSDMESESWSTVCEDVWSYIHNLTKKDSGSGKIKLFQQSVTISCVACSSSLYC